nr:YjjG family noncanonical pyrimidine nucleotidase [Maliibacterium massiliense]
MPRYQTVLLDADETLFDFRRAEAQALAQTLAAFGLPHTPALAQAYHDFNVSLWKAFERGELSKEELVDTRFTRFFAARHIDADGVSFARCYRDALGEGTFLLDGALELCRALHAHVPLYIATNGVTQTQRRRLAKSPLAPYIDHMFISEQMGAQKPQRAFFDAAFAALGHPDRARAIILGDSLTSDIQGGRNAGIATCLFDPGAQYPPIDPRYDYRITNLLDFVPIVLGEA